jgi:hypothetical protein
MDLVTEGDTHWVVVGTETGKIVVWKIRFGESGDEMTQEFQLFEIYKTRVKRVKWAIVGDKTFLVTVSTNGEMSVFDFSQEKNMKFSNNSEESRPFGALVENKIDVRITQLDVTIIDKEDVKEKTLKKMVKKEKKTQKSQLKKKSLQKPKPVNVVKNNKKVKKVKKQISKNKKPIIKKKGKKLRISVKSKM